MNLCESKYIQGISCNKKLWLSCFKKEKEEFYNNFYDEAKTKIIDLARTYFGDDYVLINQDDIYKNMVDETNKYVENKSSVICNAQFIFDDNSCSIDILKNNDDGVEIYNVKASTSINKEYIDEISYQIWILNKCGLKINKASIMYVNNQYIKNGNLNVKEFFNIEEITSYNLNNVEESIDSFKKIINQDKEPNIDLSMACNNCPFFKYCTKDLPTPNVFDIGWMTRFSKKLEIYNRGHVSYEDIMNYEKDFLNEKAISQINAYLENNNQSKPKINKESIVTFFKELKYPLYFLDFESYQAIIPTIDGTKPYQQICFQYSIHYYLEEKGELFHKEFLSDNYDNPMYDLCKNLCEDIPMNSCILTYNGAFEKHILNELANLYPEYTDHLSNIKNSILDFAELFRNQDYYSKEMHGSYSLKNVLPALFPSSPELNYHSLEQVQTGKEASEVYLKLPTLSKEDQNKLKNNMLKYCELDTYALVKIYNILLDIYLINRIFYNVDYDNPEKFEQSLTEWDKINDKNIPGKVIEGVRNKYPNIDFDNLCEITPKKIFFGDFDYENYIKAEKDYKMEWDYSSPIMHWCRTVELELRKKIYVFLESNEIKKDIREKSINTEYYINSKYKRPLEINNMMGTYVAMKKFGLIEYIFDKYIKNHYSNFILSDFQKIVEYICSINFYRDNAAHSESTIDLNKTTAEDCREKIMAYKKILEILSHLNNI